MGYRIYLRAGVVVLSIHKRVWETSERVTAHSIFLLRAELLIEFQKLDDSFKLCKE